jgi:hypothetical protein
MRILYSLAVFVGALIAATIACTWGWDRFISGTLYVCTDSVPFDFLHPGDWVHQPVTVDRIVTARSMSEPDTIRSGWSVTRLWLLWCLLVGGSVIISVLLARLPWSMSRRREQVYAHTNAV